MWGKMWSNLSPHRPTTTLITFRTLCLVMLWTQFVTLSSQQEAPAPVSLDDNIPFLRNISSDLKIEWFSEDPVLEQKLDRINFLSEFTVPDNPEENVVFKHHHDERDLRETTLYLAKGEDTLPVYPHKKKIYVGLKNIPTRESETRRKKSYAVYFAYMR